MKHTNKWLVAAALATTAAVALTGCTADSGDGGAATDDITVGFSVYDM